MYQLLLLSILAFPFCLTASSEPSFTYIKEVKGNKTVTIRCLNEIAEDLLFCDNKTLIIIGLDNTLLQSAEALSHKDWFKATVTGFSELGLSKAEAWNIAYPYWIEYQKKGSVKLIEESFRVLLSRAIENNKLILAYTEKSFEDRELVNEQLQSLNIQLSVTPTVPWHHNFSLSNSFPLPVGIASGVIFLANNHTASDFQKMITLLQNQLIERHFDKIIFIDEDPLITTTFHEACQNLGIQSLTVTYTALRYQPKVYSHELSKIQHTFTEKLLSNEAAALLLRNNMTS